MTQSDSNAAGRAKILAATVAVGNPARSTDLMHAWNLTAREPGDPSTVSIGERSAILPSPNRSVRYKGCSVNYINLHTQTIPIPRGKQAHFCGSAVMGIGLSRAALWGRGQSPLGAGRVSVVDFGEVSRPRKLALRWRSRGGAARGFAGDSEVVQNLAYGVWLRDRG